MKYWIANKNAGHSNLWRIKANKVLIFSWIHKDWTNSITTEDMLTKGFKEITEKEAKSLFPQAFK